MPCFKTIANFRKDNRKGFRKLFKCFREFCNGLELYGKTTVAIDGSKFRAQNSKKNNYNEKKLNRHLEYIDKKTEEYLTILDEQDREEGEENPATHQRLKDLAERRVKYKELKEELERREELQISTTDPDARALPLHMKIVEVGYNVQSSVDDKHNLVVEYEVTNEKDDNALAPMVFKSKAALGMQEADPLTALADKGYHKGEQLEKCQSKSIDTLVAPKEYVDNTKPENLRKEKFVYDKESDTYTCPNGEILKKQKRYHRRKKGKIVSSFDRYTIRYSVCVTCPHYEDCISPAKKKQSQGRCIDRFEYQDAIDRNKEEVTARKEEYRRRQAIVEHPFGTIKRQWGYNYTLLKTIPKVQTEFSIIFLCYNLRRVMSILGIEGIKEALRIGISKLFRSIASVINHIIPYSLLFYLEN
jgi:hypothetical protein